jgi:hypothetical protein
LGKYVFILKLSKGTWNLSNAQAKSTGHFGLINSRVHPRIAPVWSSAFRRLGAFTTFCRVNAELRTKRPLTSGEVCGCTLNSPETPFTRRLCRIDFGKAAAFFIN